MQIQPFIFLTRGVRAFFFGATLLLALLPRVSASTRAVPSSPSSPASTSASDEDVADDTATIPGPSRLPHVTGVRHWSTPEYTRVAIEVDQNVKFDAQRIAHPDRIFFDLLGARLPSGLVSKSFDIGDGRLKRIRVAEFQPGRARIVLELEALSSYDVFVTQNPYRLMVDIHGGEFHEGNTRDADIHRGNVHGRDIHSRQKRTASAAARRSTQEAYAAVANGDRSPARSLGLKIGKIVIDAGHGGYDTGTIGPDGLREKDLVLDVAKRLGRLLDSRLGAEVVYTRQDDTFIPLDTRTAIANREQADLFISIHANSSRDSEARGVETYYPNFSSSPRALEVASGEDDVSEKSVHYVVKKTALRDKINESRELAGDVQESLCRGLALRNSGIPNRGIKKGPFTVLVGANMPSILAEISFLSNPTDERKLETPEYRQRIAESLYRGISTYVNGVNGVKVVASKGSRSEGQ